MLSISHTQFYVSMMSNIRNRRDGGSNNIISLLVHTNDQDQSNMGLQAAFRPRSCERGIENDRTGLGTYLNFRPKVELRRRRKTNS